MPTDLTPFNKGRKWTTALAIVLGLLFLFKSCQSCSRKQEIAFYKYNTGNYIDSVLDINKALSDSVLFLRSKADVLEKELEMYKIENQNLKDDKQHLKRVNSRLVERDN